MTENFLKAAAMHGHRCPGLAIGVRAAEEALRLLQVEDIDDKRLMCVAENKACYLDGIQVLTHCTFGNGRLTLRDVGKTAFSFWLGEKSVRLMLRPLPAGHSKEELIEWLLTAPVEEVYAVGAPRCECPVFVPGKKETGICAVCGEECNLDRLTVVNGRTVCADCGER